MKKNNDINTTINKIRKYFSGLDLTIEQVIEMYLRNDFTDNICEKTNLNDDDIKKQKLLVKRKYI